MPSPGEQTNGVGGSSLKVEETKKRGHRKSTTSSLPSFMVSAPGKVIVFGEHAVVHGKGSIAAALSLRSYLLVTPLPKDTRTITLRFPDIELDHTWNIDSLPWSAFQAPGKKKYYFDTIHRLDPDLLDLLKPFVSSIGDTSKKHVRQSAASCFLYLYLTLGSQHAPPAIYALRSTIPIGAGLGSSASVSVCLSAALQLQMGTLTTPYEGMKPAETKLQIKRINSWAYVGEVCIHGNPSGVDNTVATQGKAVFFKRRDYTLPPEVTPLKSFPELPLLLVNTKQPRRTAEQVSKVTKLLETHPEITHLMLDTIDKITLEANTIIHRNTFDQEPMHSSLIRLGELCRINHGLLVSLGVSHPKLERIRELVDDAGFGWTKLTGAGGGGCSLTLIKPGIKPDVKRDLEDRLVGEGFETYEVTIGGDGVGVLWPALVPGGSSDGGTVEEISQEMFLSAKGVEGIEELFGVAAVGCGNGKASGVGWRFWRGGLEK